MATDPLHFDVFVIQGGKPWFVRSLAGNDSADLTTDRQVSHKFGKLNAEDVAKRFGGQYVREDQPIQLQESVMKKAAKKSAKKSTPKATPKAATKSAEPKALVLGKTRELIVDGMKAGKALAVTFKGNAMESADLGGEKVRVVGVKQLAGLKFIEPQGEKKDGVQQFKLTDVGKAYEHK